MGCKTSIFKKNDVEQEKSVTPETGSSLVTSGTLLLFCLLFAPLRLESLQKSDNLPRRIFKIRS
jgi:hypothetical protein